MDFLVLIVFFTQLIILLTIIKSDISTDVKKIKDELNEMKSLMVKMKGK